MPSAVERCRCGRQALGQLLDYARARADHADPAPRPVPELPISEDVALLNRYGIDCVHHTNDGDCRSSRF